MWTGTFIISKNNEASVEEQTVHTLFIAILPLLIINFFDKFIGYFLPVQAFLLIYLCFVNDLRFLIS